MIRASLFYLRCSWKNRLFGWARKLKEPRTALAALFAIGYLVLMFVLPSLDRQPVDGEADPRNGQVFGGGAMLLFMTLSSLWTAARDRGLALPKAELMFLIGAPVTRRAVVAFALIYQQPGLALSALFLALLSGPGSAATALSAALTLWLTMHAVSLLGFATRQFGARCAHRGLPQVAYGPFAAFIAAVIGGLGWSVSELGIPRSLEAITALSEHPGAAAVFAPLKLVGRGFYAPSLTAALESLGMLALVNLALLATTLWSPPPFEEDSLAISERIEAFRAGGRQGLRAHREARRQTSSPRPQPFALEALGPPWVAIAWKNVISCGRGLNPGRLVIAVAASALGGAALSAAFSEPPALVPQMVAAVIAYLTLLGLLLGAQHMRNDLRLDIPHFESLKSYPLSARQLLYGEVLGLGSVLCGYTLVSVVGVTCMLAGVGDDPESWVSLPWTLRGPILVSLLPLFTSLILTVVTQENLVALWWPDFARIGPKPKAGFTQLGVTMIGLLLRAFGIGCSLILPTLLGGGTFALALWSGAEWSIALLPMSLLASATLLAQCAAAIELAAPAYSRFDPRSFGSGG